LCRLQTWFADDVDHRLTAGKLLKILDKAKSFLASDELDVDVEHEVGYISQFPLELSRHTAYRLFGDGQMSAAVQTRSGIQPIKI
jgi:hypothetical protein